MDPKPSIGIRSSKVVSEKSAFRMITKFVEANQESEDLLDVQSDYRVSEEIMEKLKKILESKSNNKTSISSNLSSVDLLAQVTTGSTKKSPSKKRKSNALQDEEKHS